MAVKINTDLFSKIGEQLAGSGNSKALFDNLYKQGMYTMEQDKRAMDALEAQNPSGINLGQMPKGLEKTAQDAVVDLSKEYKRLAWEATYRPKKKDAAVRRMNEIKTEMTTMKQKLNKALLAEKHTIDNNNNFGILTSNEVAMRNARATSDYGEATWDGSDFVTNLGGNTVSVTSAPLTIGEDPSGKAAVLKAITSLGKMNDGEYKAYSGQTVSTIVGGMSPQAKLDVAVNGIKDENGVGTSIFDARLNEIKKTKEYRDSVSNLQDQDQQVTLEDAEKIQNGLEMQKLINSGISDEDLVSHILGSAKALRPDIQKAASQTSTSKQTNINLTSNYPGGIYNALSNTFETKSIWADNNPGMVKVLDAIIPAVNKKQVFLGPFGNTYRPKFSHTNNKFTGYVAYDQYNNKIMKTKEVDGKTVPTKEEAFFTERDIRNRFTKITEQDDVINIYLNSRNPNNAGYDSNNDSIPDFAQPEISNLQR